MSRGAIALLALGLLQMAGSLTGVRPLRDIAAATMASPAPAGFSAAGGHESYSTRAFLDRLELTAEVYARLRGPESRRDIYSAVLSSAPVLPPALRDPVLRHAFCGERPLLRELGGGVPASGSRLSLHYQTRPGMSPPPLSLPLTIEIPCDDR